MEGSFVFEGSRIDLYLGDWKKNENGKKRREGRKLWSERFVF